MSDNAETETTEPWEKKSERFEVRLPFSKKQAFVEACEEQGDTPSEAVRRFIHTYLRRAREDNMGMARRSLRHKARQHWAYGTAGIMAIAVVSIIGPQGCAHLDAQRTLEAKQALFVNYDKNGDAVLTRGEVAQNDKALHDVLDIDDSGDIAFDEFFVEGRMQISQSNSSEKPNLARDFKSRKLVVFNLNNTQSPVLSVWGVDSGDLEVSDSMDRLVHRDIKTNELKYYFSDAAVIYDGDGKFESIKFNVEDNSFDKSRGAKKEKNDQSISSPKSFELQGNVDIKASPNGGITILADEITTYDKPQSDN